ncbi:MAG: aldo/keto reductase [Candidatus Melainabacteria bacterium]|mgnify:CR=1 FL=1|nr:aldo/keto reductase [Candidatus Melainabacteria bacterium]
MTPTAYNQVPIPSFMYGTAWKKDDTARLVKLAVEAGFKAIDTANQLVHYNEALVGEALLDLQKTGVTRESLFLQTKFTSIGGQGNLAPPYDKSAKLADQVKQSIDSSLKHLHTDYLDSYVLHGPYYRNKLGAEDWEVWGAIEEIYDSGKAKMIGISNVSAEQLAELVAKSKTKPMVVQNRCYAIAGWDEDVREICSEHGIIYQGFSLLTANQRVLTDPAVRAIAERLNTGVAQVIFKFAMQIGMLPLTGTTSAQRMKDDLKAEQLELTAEDMKALETVGMTAQYS